MVKTKICTKCNIEKELTIDYFSIAKQNKDGFRGQCKECMKEIRVLYREANREKLNEKHREYAQDNKEKLKENRKKNEEKIRETKRIYYLNNKERIRQYQIDNKESIKRNKAIYRQANKEKINEYFKDYRSKNIERFRERMKIYQQENPGVLRESNKLYRMNNPEKIKLKNAKRKAKKKNLPCTLSTQQWGTIKKDFDNSCAYCGITEEQHLKETEQQLHQEHFIPLDEGGEYTHNNIIPACRSCNSSKRNSDFFEWYPTFEHYSEEREQFILEYLGYKENTQQLSIL